MDQLSCLIGCGQSQLVIAILGDNGPCSMDQLDCLIGMTTAGHCYMGRQWSMDQLGCLIGCGQSQTGHCWETMIHGPWINWTITDWSLLGDNDPWSMDQLGCLIGCGQSQLVIVILGDNGPLSMEQLGCLIGCGQPQLVIAILGDNGPWINWAV
jgi:hypothetical protein